MTECGTAAFDVPFQSISECVRIKTAVSKIFNTSTGGADVTFVSSSLAVARLSSAVALMCLTPSIAKLPSASVTRRPALLSGRLVRKRAY